MTLVRRDKDEEKMLVSYFVPVHSWKGTGLRFFIRCVFLIDDLSDIGEEKTSDANSDEGGVEGGIRRYAPLIKDIRAHLKKKLPGYSIPTCKSYKYLNPVFLV